MRKEFGAPLFYTPCTGNGQIGRRAPAPGAAKIETSVKKMQVTAGGCGYDF
jgi:hypothetical protein